MNEKHKEALEKHEGLHALYGEANSEFYAWESQMYGDNSPLSDDERLAWVSGFMHAQPTANIPRLSMNVQVLVKTNYGTKHFYPANETAKLFLRIQGGKTLTKDTLKILIDAGFDVNFEYEEITV